MTGFGKAVCELENKNLVIEIKSLNSKQLDLNCRMPSFYREKEFEVRNMVNNSMIRGKVDFVMYSEMSNLETVSTINAETVKVYYEQLVSVSQQLGVDSSSAQMFEMAMRMPDVLKTEHEDLTEDEWSIVAKSVQQAIDALVAFRTQEGAALEKDLTKRINLIQSLLAKVPEYERPRIDRIKERIKGDIAELVGLENLDKNRLEQELIFYIEKLDITEEKVRLANHCDYFLKTMQQGGPVGRQLGFVAQEIGREINTLGSKANDSDLQIIVVAMKDELEKIKEQILNVL